MTVYNLFLYLLVIIKIEKENFSLRWYGKRLFFKINSESQGIILHSFTWQKNKTKNDC